MRTFMSDCCCVTVLAMALSACDSGSAGGVAGITTAPSAFPSVTASISFVTAFQIPVLGIDACTVASQTAAAFDIVIVASTPMRLDNVTIQLIDGSHLGGPMVTFPQAALTTQFGTTVVLAGVARTFTFLPQFPCGAQHSNRVAAQLTLLDSKGVPHGVTAAASLP